MGPNNLRCIFNVRKWERVRFPSLHRLGHEPVTRELKLQSKNEILRCRVYETEWEPSHDHHTWGAYEVQRASQIRFVAPTGLLQYLGDPYTGTPATVDSLDQTQQWASLTWSEPLRT